MSILNSVRAFEAAARNRNITGAAKELGLSQAAVSKQIQLLEAKMGVQLLHRDARGVSPTVAGIELYEDISRGLQRISAALEKTAKSPKGVTSLLCNSSFAIRILVPLMSDLNENLSHLNLSLKTFLYSHDPLLAGRSEAEIYFGGTSRDGATVLAESPMRWVQGAGGTQTEGMKTLVRTIGYERIFKDLEPQYGMETDSFHASIELAVALQGKTVAPSLLVADYIRQKKLLDLGVSDSEQLFYWFIARSSRGRELGKWLSEKIQKLNSL